MATVSARALIRRAAAPRIRSPSAGAGPSVGRDRASVAALDDDRRRVGRGEVEVAAGVVDERLGLEQLGQLGGRALLGEPAAHRPDRNLDTVRAMDPTAPEPGAASDADRRVRRPPAVPGPLRSRDPPSAGPARSADRAGLPGDRRRSGGSAARRWLLPAGHRVRRPGDHRGGDRSASATSSTGSTGTRTRWRPGARCVKLGETPSTYPAWRQIAAALVRDGDLTGAAAAYREADRRAPAEDKAEIASRLGWLAKETGDPRGARRYFARSRGGTGLPIPLTYLIIGLTVIVSLAASTTDDDRTWRS